MLLSNYEPNLIKFLKNNKKSNKKKIFLKRKFPLKLNLSARININFKELQEKELSELYILALTSKQAIKLQ